MAFSITLNSYKETQYEETYFIKVWGIYVLRNIANLENNSLAVQFESIGYWVRQP